MLVSTGNGLKQWLYYVQDPEQWIATLNESVSGHRPYPSEIKPWRDTEWVAWREFSGSEGEPLKA
jgi:Family of unknown function (DUF695)